MDVAVSLNLLADAVRQLFNIETLAFADPGEPHVVSELFYLLRPRFPEHDVSNEYDRRVQEVKRLGTSKIVPDLIVHEIGTQDRNLLVIEMKLVTNTDCAGDIRKLRGMTDRAGAYGYAVGVHLVLDIPGRAVSRAEVYADGAADPALTEHLTKLLMER
ncbi:MAG: hypothetical protein H0W24_09245 [Lysobacter sp.]|nr:hypothetical protein [Lysobacter sp.]